MTLCHILPERRGWVNMGTKIQIHSVNANFLNWYLRHANVCTYSCVKSEMPGYYNFFRSLCFNIWFKNVLYLRLKYSLSIGLFLRTYTYKNLWVIISLFKDPRLHGYLRISAYSLLSRYLSLFINCYQAFRVCSWQSMYTNMFIAICQFRPIHSYLSISTCSQLSISTC